ncbi:MAG: hypothetical protein H3C64_08040 [Candidatus Kuenenia stuttgartiensis]|nr:hypothetical protein [Candidatus Kuenenia stuttgartiensis]
MKSIAFLGAKTIGLECLKILLEKREEGDYSIDAVFTNLNRNTEVNMQLLALAKENDLNVYEEINELLDLDKFDVIISVQYHEILKKEHISRAGLAINLHMAPLPEYRGCNQFSYAIINGAKVFGTTLHVIDERIDNGDIIAEYRFDIPENCFVDELYEETMNHSLALFQENIVRIVKGDYVRIPQKELVAERGTMTGYRRDIDKLKQIDLSWDKERIAAHIRATSMYGFDPPYTVIGCKKVHLIVDRG